MLGIVNISHCYIKQIKIQNAEIVKLCHIYLSDYILTCVKLSKYKYTNLNTLNYVLWIIGSINNISTGHINYYMAVILIC